MSNQASLGVLTVDGSTDMLRKAEERDVPELVDLLAVDGDNVTAAIFEWAIAEARRRGCALVQLTTDKSRTDARRFYQRLGFVASTRA